MLRHAPFALLAFVALAPLACGRSIILDDDEGGHAKGGRGAGASGAAGGIGGVGGQGGAAGALTCPSISAAVTLLPETSPSQSRPRLAVSSEEEGRVSVVYALSQALAINPALRHSFVWPWGTWPPTIELSSLLYDSPPGVAGSFDVAPWSTNRIAVLFRSNGGVYYAGNVNPVLTAPPIPAPMDAAATEVTFLAGSALAHLAGRLDMSTASNEDHVVTSVGADPGGNAVFGWSTPVGCGQPSGLVGDAIATPSGWLVASTTGALAGDFCAPSAPPNFIRVTSIATNGTSAFGSDFVGGANAIRMVLTPGGAWVFWTANGAPVLGARVDEQGTNIEGPLVLSPPGLVPKDPPSLAAAAFDAAALLAWATPIGIAVERVGSGGVIGEPVLFPTAADTVGGLDLASRAIGDLALMAWTENGVVRLARVACPP